MRMNIACSTHAHVKRLIAAGVPEAPAEMQCRLRLATSARRSEALAEIALANLAIKDDLREGLRPPAERMSTQLESELRKQMLCCFTAQVALFGAPAALFKLR
jgi:hypothetical protein